MSRCDFTLVVINSAVLYRGVDACFGMLFSSSKVELSRMFECEGERRCNGMGDALDGTGMTLIRALSFVKSSNDPSSTPDEC